MTQENLPARADAEHVETGEVPAGGRGADSGAAEAVGIDRDDTAGVQNVSTQNDIAGVGTRGPEAADSGAAPAETEQQQRAADPGFVRADEAPGAAAHNARVSERDAEDPVRAQNDDAFQHLPRMAQNDATHEQELAGIVAQTRADLRLGIPETRTRDIIAQRLDDAGIGYDDALLGDLEGRVLSR